MILSPQAWGNMFLSKHHYAIELAKRGNRVYFLNPPDDKKKLNRGEIKISSSGLNENLFFIEQNLFFPYNIKFHAMGLFQWLMKFHIRKIMKAISAPVDIVWSFELGNLYPFKLFGAGIYKIFHPVDEPLNQHAINAAAGADIIFSVTNEILEKYRHYNIPAHFINHGVTQDFLLPVDINKPSQEPVHIGLSGNFLRPDIDRETLLQIIDENANVVFDCWGSYHIDQTNIGGAADEGTRSFIQQLQAKKNVVLHGVLSSTQLATAIHAVDGFLICYDVEKDQSKGTNYHKLIEYLSTGKVVISNNVSTYKDQPALVQMIAERTHNRTLPALFKKVVSDLPGYNDPQLQQQRIAFANNNTYPKQIERISQILAHGA